MEQQEEEMCGAVSVHKRPGRAALSGGCKMRARPECLLVWVRRLIRWLSLGARQADLLAPAAQPFCRLFHGCHAAHLQAQAQASLQAFFANV